MSWRYLADDGVSAAFGLAADEVLARRQGTGASPPTLRLYTYASHCALVGRFQRVALEVRLPFCRAHGIAVNRRPTGGGAIIMGADQDHRYVEFAILNIGDLEPSGSGGLCCCRGFGCSRCLCGCGGATSCEYQCCYYCQKQELTHCLLLLRKV